MSQKSVLPNCWVGMIGKYVVIILGLLLIFCLAEFALAGNSDGGCSAMTPGSEGFLGWIGDYEMAPRAYIDPSIHLDNASGGFFSLLSHLKYNPAERDQGSCNNGWAWADTGVMAIALDVQEQILDSLSVQFINSCNTNANCCDFAISEDFSEFYAAEGIAIPWTNTNANWQDGDGKCNVPCGSIATWPNYGIDSIVTETLATHGVGQTQAIANIKNVLHQNKAVSFLWVFPTKGARDDFVVFWSTQKEDITGTLNYCCGQT